MRIGGLWNCYPTRMLEFKLSHGRVWLVLTLGYRRLLLICQLMSRNGITQSAHHSPQKFKLGMIVFGLRMCAARGIKYNRRGSNTRALTWFKLRLNGCRAPNVLEI
jgi:hypothetical protein